MSDLSHLAVSSQAIALQTEKQRIDWIQHERWIEYSRASSALGRLEELIRYPPRDRMPCILLYGQTGMGKTTILQKFLRAHPDSFDSTAGRSVVTIACIQMPPHPNEKHFYQELLVSMGSVLPDGMSIGMLRHRVRVLARQLGVRMIVIDEVHSLLAGTFREQRIMLNSFRFLANDLRVPLVCAGTHEAKTALLTDDQLADRFEVCELPKWKDDNCFQQLLLSFISLLPLRQHSNLREAKVRKRLLSITGGVTVRICRVLEAAAIAAIKSGDERIELETLTEDLLVTSLASISERRSRSLQPRA